MASVPGKRVYRTNRKAAEQGEVGVGAQGDRRQTPPAPSGPPAPAAGDGQGGAGAKKIYAVFSVGPMQDRALLGVYHAATPLDACKLAQPCCYDFDPPSVDEYDGLNVYEVPATGSVAYSRYVAGFVMRRVDWPDERDNACSRCREMFK